VTDLVEQLRRPAAYPQPPTEVSLRETHISYLFFAGERVYKVKKPVDLGFLDFSTLERRRHFCAEEVRLNRRLAPRTYLGVVPITRADDGSLQVAGAGEGEVVEWAVEMIRLPQERMLDRLLDRGEIDNSHMNQLADRLVRFHAEAATGEGVNEHGSVESVGYNVLENFEQTRRFAGPLSEQALVSPALHRFLEERARAFLDDRCPLLERRVAEGRIRDGHGDLWAGNICFTEEGLVIYDCIEFADRLRCGDVACDLAFLAMDLDRRGYRAFARYLAKRYAEQSDDAELVSLLPFYKGYRAMVRAKVAGIRFVETRDEGAPLEEARREAMRYFHLAAAYELGPSVVLTCGLPGTGKSWAARAVARPFEAVLASSDVRRKRLAGVPLHAHHREGWQKGLYAPELTDRTYASLLDEADQALLHGRTSVVDGTFSSRTRRAPFVELAQRRGAPLLVLLVSAGEETIRRRMAERSEDPEAVSDADLEVYRAAKETFEPPAELDARQVLDAPSGSESREELTARVLERLLSLQSHAAVRV
jgi:hypothetical protein